MNNSSFDVKIINLPHRGDRRMECINELEKINLHNYESIFFNAKYIPDAGAAGCALSHAMALSEFLFSSEKLFLMVLEDDFEIIDSAQFINTIEFAINNSSLWDVFLLGHNTAVPIEATISNEVYRIINAQTTSGYLIGRSYAATLAKCFFNSADLLTKYNQLPSPNKEIAKSFFSCDVLWKKHQIDDVFFASIPSLIKQRKSFSDIENRIVDYGV